jgi:hypothetical protein
LATLKVIEVGSKRDVHPGELGQVRRHVDAAGAPGVFVNLLQGDDVCVGLSEDVGDALKIYLTVQSLGVADVVGHHAQNHWRDIR